MEKTTSRKIEHIVNCGKVHFTEIVLEKPGIYKNPNKLVKWSGEKLLAKDEVCFICFTDNKTEIIPRSKINEMKLIDIKDFYHTDGISIQEFLKSL